MKVGFCEVISYGHFTLVECLLKVYSSDARNELFIITNQSGFTYCKEFILNYANLTILVKEDTESFPSFYYRINNLDLDYAYFVTFEQPKYFIDFYKTHFSFPIRLFIHNIDFWFEASFFERLKKFIKSCIDIKFIKILKNSFRDHFINFPYNKLIIEKVLNEGGRLVVLNELLANRVNEFLPNSNCLVFPFSYYDSSIFKPHHVNKKLRICVPGLITQRRRDYLGLLIKIEERILELKDKVVFDFLGGIQMDGNKKINLILSKINHINKLGMEILIHNESYISNSIFDKELAKCDFILSNLIAKLGYGKTKESGIPFAMIKSGRPGIYPVHHYLMPQLKTSTILYTDYDNMINQIIEISNNRQLIESYHANAITNSQYFLPENIYDRIQ